MNNPIEHVYILGAGFSFPLGGPLFNMLLTDHMTSKINRLFLDENGVANLSSLEKVITLIPSVLEECLGSSATISTRPNAEEILELAEGMVSGHPNWFSSNICNSLHNLSSLVKQVIDPETFFRLLKVRIAIETNQFLFDLNPESERWRPYDTWYGSLRSNDHIITTNYDLTLELLERRRWALTSNTEAPSYHTAFCEELNEKEYCWTVKGYGVGVSKIHGSCHAFTSRSSNRQAFWTDPRNLITRDMLIGMPGTGKKKLLKDRLNTEMAIARERLRKADVISIIGYSMPETDNDFRMELLDAIAYNRKLRRVNIVLGSPSERGRRAKTIIEHALRGGRRPVDPVSVSLTGIYAQDFLPFYRPDDVDEIDSMAFHN